MAFLDYDNDGLLDIFVVSGEGGTNRLYHNDGKGRFTDVTANMGLERRVRLGPGRLRGRLRQRRLHRPVRHLLGPEPPVPQRRRAGASKTSPKRAGLRQDRIRYNTGCAFLDYDNDGHADLFVANYLKFDPQTTPKPGDNPYCFYRELPVNLRSARPSVRPQHSLSQQWRRHIHATSREESGIAAPDQNYALGVLTGDFNDDGLVDIYVACDQTPSLLYINQGDGTFSEEALLRGVAFDENGKAMSGHGSDGRRLTMATACRTSSAATSPTNAKRSIAIAATANSTTSPRAAGLARNTRYVGWGCGFFDFDNDGWKDLLLVNGHVFPEVERLNIDIHFKDRAILYRNLGNGKFEDISESAGPGVTARHSARGAAFGDFDNDGLVEVLVNNQNEPPSLLKQATRPPEPLDRC